MTVHYSPATAGGWLALCSSASVLVLGEVPSDERRDELLGSLDDAAGIGRALDLLVRDGLANLPPFVLLSLMTRGDARVIVRGGAVVTATSPQGSESIDGSGVTTWTERVIAGAVSLAVSVVGAAPVPGVGSLGLGSGAAWVAGLVMTAGGAASVAQPAGRAAATVVPAAEEAVAEQPAVEMPAAEMPAAETPAAERPVASDPEATVVGIAVDDEPPAPAEAAAAEEPVPAAGEPASAAGEYDYLFGATMYRGVAEAAVYDEPETEKKEQEPGETPVGDHDGETVLVSELPAVGDHDGETIMTSTIAKLRSGRKRAKPPVEQSEAPAPRVILVLTDGTREPLTQPVLVGRAPSLSQASSQPIPKLLVIGTADQDISRTHARFALEGGTVVVTDLHSRNGTLVALPGKEPQKLRAGEPTSVLVGSIIDFGGGVTITVSEES